ncbi:unnamed protein product [Adineta ricciae]|uniref:Uncharacterized protein n=1 Tax=Adineta ricciae TaxID=249248 RepID=A0A814F279_ADIRI|nr:unnamed protein product [Adineta ricciae]
MDQTESNSTNTNQSRFIRKKSSFLRDGSYRIFHITEKPNENMNDNQERRENTEETVENAHLQEENVKIASQNSLKQLLFLHAEACEARSSAEFKISPASSHPSIQEFSQTTIFADSASVNLSDKNKQDTMTNLFEETSTRNLLVTRSDQFESPSRKQVFINAHPELQASFHRRRQRSLIACATVAIALTIIITITVYVIIMTVRYIAKPNQSTVQRQPRI